MDMSVRVVSVLHAAVLEHWLRMFAQPRCVTSWTPSTSSTIRSSAEGRVRARSSTILTFSDEILVVLEDGNCLVLQARVLTECTPQPNHCNRRDTVLEYMLLTIPTHQ